MLLAILAIWFGYKKARDTGRNPVLWAVICGASFIGAQFLAATGIAVFMEIGIEAWGWRETIYEDNQGLVTVAALAAAIVTMILLFRYLDRVPDEGAPLAPPPPPTFDGAP